MGEYFHIVLRPKSDFVDFRNHDVGDKGHIQRLVGKRKSGNWATHAWLISKEDAKLKDGKLYPKNEEVKEVLDSLSSVPVRVKDDLFKAKDRRNVPEREKPTAAQKKAWSTNIKKAQAANLDK